MFEIVPISFSEAGLCVLVLFLLTLTSERPRIRIAPCAWNQASSAAFFQRRWVQKDSQRFAIDGCLVCVCVCVVWVCFGGFALVVCFLSFGDLNDLK